MQILLHFLDPWSRALGTVQWRAWVVVFAIIVIVTVAAVVGTRRMQPRAPRTPAEPRPAGSVSRREEAVRDLTLVSVIVGIVLACIGYVQTSAQTLTNRTLDLLSNISLNEKIAESDFHMARWISDRERFTGDVEPEVDVHIINLLDYYEFLGVAWEQGAVHEETLMIARCGPMIRAWTVNERYIADRRASLAAPNLYHRFEMLVDACIERGFGT